MRMLRHLGAVADLAVRGATATPLTPLGWTVAATAVVAWLLGAALGWSELLLASATCLLTLALAVGFVVGRARLEVAVELDALRVSVGEPVAGRVTARNASAHRLLAFAIELPVGAATARLDVPSLGPGAEHEELLVIPTSRRGVVTVGPATSMRGDPVGLLRRALGWHEPAELFVHPRVVALEGLGAGFLRDLEGQATNTTSVSDLAFHALREYVPGDDRRHVHWRTSARLGTLMVQQFVDTRRSHLLAVVDGDESSYARADDFECALSAAGSVALRALRDRQMVSATCAGHAVRPGSDLATGRMVLDSLARAELLPGQHDLLELCSRASRDAPDVSTVLLATGSCPQPADLRAAAARFPIDTQVLVLRVDPTGAPGASRLGDVRVLTIARLEDLGPLMRVTVRA